MASNKPRPRQAGQLHRIAALGYHADGNPTSSARAIRKVQDSQGNAISAPRKGIWNGATNELLMSLTSGKGKGRAVEANDDRGPGPSSRRHPGERVGVATRSMTSASKKKKRQFLDCVLLPPRPKSRHGTSGQRQGSPEPPPLPDSDFLKLIHYSASTFYESRGQLRDRSELLAEVLHGGDDLREAKRKHAKGRASGPSRQRAQNAAKMKTMHTAFGGDVLIALGILLEEDIIQQLKSTELPEGWDEMEIVDDEMYPMEGNESVDDEDEGSESQASAGADESEAGPSVQNTENMRQTRSMVRQSDA